jgi:DNA-binding MarR family transcriptional regulator
MCKQFTNWRCGIEIMANRPQQQKSRCNCTMLRKASRRISQLYDSALEPCGLRTTQRAILAQIARSGTPSLGELAEAMVMDRGALTHNLKPLERDRLVDIRVDPDDRRNRLVVLTSAGSRKLEESASLWQNAQASFERAFGRAKSAALREALDHIVSEDFALAFSRR